MIMKNQKVSVVIPVHNGERTLGQCMESVLRQNYHDYEVIIVDDNSTDGTREIIKKFQRNNAKVGYVFEEKVSRGAARNSGVKHAKGNIIAMTDADCVVPADWIDKLTEPIRRGNEIAVQGNEVDTIGNYWTKMQQSFNQRFLEARSAGDYIDHVDTKNFAVDREILENVGFFDSRIGNLEDFELKIRLKKCGHKIFFLKDLKVAHFHRDSFSKLFSRRLEQGFWATVIHGIHSDYFSENDDEMVKSINSRNFTLFFPWAVATLFRDGFSRFLFEIVTGTAWRIGILAGLLRRRNFRPSVRPSNSEVLP